MNISLPESMRSYIDEQIEQGGYGTASEYVRALIREDQKRRAQERLETLLLEGLDSGPPITVTPEYWKDLRKEFFKRHGIKEEPSDEH
jgi:antitoxin ParD1/3/4